MKYKDWLDEWLELYVRPTVKEKTFLNYASIVRLHIKPCLGEYELEELTLNSLQAFVSELSRDGNTRTGGALSSGTIGLVISVVQKSLSFAERVGRVDRQYSSYIVRPRQRRKSILCFTVSEQRRIERDVLSKPKSNRIGVLICLYTGLRIGELLALKWKDVDLIRGLISVKATCRDGCRDGKPCKIIDTPKTESSIRKIPIPKQMLPLLRGYKKSSDSEFVISGKSGDISVRSYQKIYTAILNRQGIEYRNFHTLRHTFATRALECGMDVKTLSEILGHHSPTITLNCYAHSTTEHKTNMMNKVGKLLTPPHS